MANTIQNGCNTPLTIDTGTIPDVSGALEDWYQPMIFTRITKQTINFQEVEIETDINFRGVIQILQARDLLFKPEGQRAWTWYRLHSDPVLELEVDEVVKYLGVNTRVMSLKDYRINGYVEYHLVQDWVNA